MVHLLTPPVSLTAKGKPSTDVKNSVTGYAFGELEVGSEVRLVIAESEGVEGAQASTVTPIGKHHIVE